MTGQLAIRWIANKLNAYMNKALKTNNVDYIIASDTDSVMMSLETLVETTQKGKTTKEKIEFMDTFCDKILAPFISKSYQELADYLGSYEQRMIMKREVLADKGLFSCCHPKTNIIIDNTMTTIEELFNSSVDGIVDSMSLSYNKHTDKFEQDVIEEVLRRPFVGDMYEFYLESGEVLKVTSNHVIFVKRGGIVMEVEAANVLEDDDFISI
jgi:hypothetical protein